MLIQKGNSDILKNSVNIATWKKLTRDFKMEEKCELKGYSFSKTYIFRSQNTEYEFSKKLKLTNKTSPWS